MGFILFNLVVCLLVCLFVCLFAFLPFPFLLLLFSLGSFPFSFMFTIAFFLSFFLLLCFLRAEVFYYRIPPPIVLWLLSRLIFFSFIFLELVFSFLFFFFFFFFFSYLLLPFCFFDHLRRAPKFFVYFLV